MSKKALIQSFLIIIIFFTCWIFYKTFLTNPITKLENIENDEWKSKSVLKKGANQMKDIVYYSKYLNDNNYVIKAEFAEFSEDNSSLMLLTNVKGVLYLEDSETIEITSKRASYNSIDYSTNFYQNVIITFKDHQINSDNFDLFFDKKISTIYNNIIYKNLNTLLLADKIDIDLITKNSKIYMLDKSKKINIKFLN